MDLMDISGVGDALHNCLQHHTNEVVSSVDDERNFLRIWRRRWRDLVSSENGRIFDFLQICSDVSGVEFFRPLRTIPPNSNWFRTHVRSVVDLSGVEADVSTRIGIDYSHIRASLHIAFNRYTHVLGQLFELESRLNGSLDRLSALQTALSNLVFDDLSGSPTVVTLQTSILEYVQSAYTHLGFDRQYIEFMNCYAEWFLLRGLVLGHVVISSEATQSPLCSVCTTEKINSALIPCGHTFCNNCAMRQRNFCYICRTNVRERMRIYFV